MLEIKIKLPGSIVLEFKRKPMERDRFWAVCWLIGIFMVGSGILKFFSMVT